jgi:hypothetical protein
MFSQKFDYIRGRILGSYFASHLNVFKSEFDASRPGGWIEMQYYEFPFRCVDNSIKGTGFEKWIDAVSECCAKLGRDWKRVPLYSRYMRECGFADVQETLVAWPVGSWAKDEKMKTLGAWCKENVGKYARLGRGCTDMRIRNVCRGTNDANGGEKFHQFEKTARFLFPCKFPHLLREEKRITLGRYIVYWRKPE